MSSPTPSTPVATVEKKSASIDSAPVEEKKDPSPSAPHPPSVPGTESTNPGEHTRTSSADDALTPQQKVKLAKAELKEVRRQSKILKEEAKAEKQALATAGRELSGLQKVHSVAIKNEAKANAKHTKVMSEFQKHEAVFLAARTKFEAAQARLHAEDENVGIVRNNAKEATDTLQEKTKEVDSLRAKCSLDDKERTVKLNELAAKGAGDNGCIIC